MALFLKHFLLQLSFMEMDLWKKHLLKNGWEGIPGRALSLDQDARKAYTFTAPWIALFGAQGSPSVFLLNETLKAGTGFTVPFGGDQVDLINAAKTSDNPVMKAVLGDGLLPTITGVSSAPLAAQITTLVGMPPQISTAENMRKTFVETGNALLTGQDPITVTEMVTGAAIKSASRQVPAIDRARKGIEFGTTGRVTSSHSGNTLYSAPEMDIFNRSLTALLYGAGFTPQAQDSRIADAKEISKITLEDRERRADLADKYVEFAVKAMEATDPNTQKRYQAQADRYAQIAEDEEIPFSDRMIENRFNKLGKDWKARQIDRLSGDQQAKLGTLVDD